MNAQASAHRLPELPGRQDFIVSSGVAVRLTPLLLLALSDFGLAADARATQHVLIVRMSDVSLPASMLATRGLMETLEAEVAAPLVVSDESLDSVENLALSPTEEAREAAHLREKFAGTHIDLILVAGSGSLAFMLRHRHEFAPAAPIAYYSVSDRAIRAETLGSDIGGVAFHWDLAGTLDLALHLQPRATNVIYISGVAPYDMVFEPLFDEAVAALPRPLLVTKLIGRPLGELQRQLSTLPEDSIVLYTSMFLDVAGTRYRPADIVRPLSGVSAGPIYTVASSYVGRGALGGSVVDFEEQGRAAAKYTAHLLEQLGDSRPLSLETHVVPPTCLIDAERLEHWGLPVDRAPAQCRLVRAPPPPPKSTRATLMGGVGLALFAALMAAAALVQQRKRRTAQQQIAHSARLAVIGEISASIMHEVTQPLSAILSNADAAEILLGSKNPSIESVLEILADIRRDDARAHRIVTRLRSLLRNGELQIDRLDLNELVSSSVQLIRSEFISRQTAIETLPASNLPPVDGDAAHLQQVILNVLVNALDSMEAVPAAQRRIEISTGIVAGESVFVLIRDHGPGIPARDLSRIFDSFHTTKRNGMGLGLSIAKTIIESHGGTIRASNAIDGGAEFRIILPIRAHS